MKKILLFIFWGYSVSQLYSQGYEVIISNLTQEEIPENITYQGSIIEAKKWEDKNGTNVLVISRYGPYRTPGSTIPVFELGNVDLNFCQYSIKGDKIALLWKYSDSIRKCETDMWIECFPNSTLITDLDKNGLTETTIVYRYACRGGVDPSHMKVILHENMKTYELKGLMYIPFERQLDKTTFDPDLSKVSEKEFKEHGKKAYLLNYGRFENDNSFKEAPPTFLKLAKNQWLMYCDQDSFRQFDSRDHIIINK